MEKFSFRSALSQLLNALIGGMLIAIGGCVSLSCDNKYIGSFLFSLGLFTIIQFGYGLYTGKIGYAVEKKPGYLLECLFTLLGNALGTFLTAALLSVTRFGAPLATKAAASVDTKVADDFYSSFILAFFCGLLMYTAVENARMSREDGGHFEKALGAVMCVMVFILCGFNHCIADMFYIFISGRIAEAAVYLPIVILGNSVGGIFFPAVRKFIVK